jgi:hypothetical protein
MDNLEHYTQYRLNSDFFQKIVLAANHATRPFDLNLNKRMRIVIDYDPHEPQVKFDYFTEPERAQEE